MKTIFAIQIVQYAIEDNKQLFFVVDNALLVDRVQAMASEYKQLGILRADFDTEHLPENFIVKYNLSNIKPED